MFSHEYTENIPVFFLLFIFQPDDLSLLKEELLEMGMKIWWPPYESLSSTGIDGCIEFETVEHALQVLIKGSSIKSVTFQHKWYINWSWILSLNRDETFFEGIDQQLNDDCIFEIIKHLDILHRLYFASINERFERITLMGELSRDLRIFPSSVGSIHLINLRFLLQKIGSSVINLSISLKSFPSTLGFYYSHIKKYILEIIYAFTGPKLKKIHLYDFEMNERLDTSVYEALQLFVPRGVEVKFC